MPKGTGEHGFPTSHPTGGGAVPKPTGTNRADPERFPSAYVPSSTTLQSREKPTLADAAQWAARPSLWHVHRYAVGALSLHSGDEYHCQEYPNVVHNDDWRLTLQLHGLWTGECWELFW